MNKKYEFTGETMEWSGHTLRRIRAVRMIYDAATAGAIGGWIEDETNLSHEGSAWVYDNAKIFGGAKVFDNAKLLCDAEVFGKSEVYGSAIVFGSAMICDNAKVHGNAVVGDNAKVHGRATIHGHAKVFDSANVYDTAEVFGTADIVGKAKLRDGKVGTSQSHICLGPVGSRDAYVTLNLASGTICTGCFKGTIDDFEAAVKNTHGDNKHSRNYAMLISYFRMLLANNTKLPDASPH